MQVSDTVVERKFRLLKGFLLIGSLCFLFWIPGSSEQRSFVEDWAIWLLAAAWIIAWYLRFIRSKRRVGETWPRDLLLALFVCSALASGWVLYGRGELDFLALLMGVVFVAVFWSGWIVSDERPDEAWTGVFNRVLGEGGIAELNTAFYFDSIAGRIRNLVQETMYAGRIHDDASGETK